MEKIMMKKILLVTLIVVFGCNQRLPDNMPRLYPLTVTVTQEGRTLDDATVALTALDEGNPWTSGSRTDKNGVATIRTHGRYDGVPAGKYKVCIKKILVEGDPPPSEMELFENPGMPRGKPQELYHVVPLNFNDPEKTPFEVEVKESSNKCRLEIPETVKIPVIDRAAQNFR